MDKKYIDLDTLNGWEIELSRTTDRGYETITTTAKELAEVLPVADVTEVVRCEDCAVPHNHWTGCPRMNGTIMRPDDYCSYGKRKEGK